MSQSNSSRRIQSDGLELVVEEFGNRSGAPLIFAHGLTSNRAQSRLQMAPLAERYRLIVFDQRGHAESSPVTDPALYDVRRMAGDIAAILDALGIEQAIVGGESMGAATALRFALNWPARVRALILALPALADSRNEARQTVKDIGAGIKAMGMAAFAAHNERAEIANGASPQRAARWAAVLRSHQTESMALACEIVPDWIVYDSSTDLQRLQMPVQIIAIDGDPVHPLELAQRLKTAIPQAQLALPQPNDAYFEQPEVVGRICRAWLDELS